MLNRLVITVFLKNWGCNKCYKKRTSSHMIIIHMFYQGHYKICFIICYQSFSFFNVRIMNMHKIIVTKQTSHDLRIFRINFLIIIYKIKNPTNCIPILSFPFFPLSMQVWNILSMLKGNTKRNIVLCNCSICKYMQLNVICNYVLSFYN